MALSEKCGARPVSRDDIRNAFLEDETASVDRLLRATPLDRDARKAVAQAAAALVADLRRHSGKGPIDRLMQEFGLGNREGVALMRLAEAMLRTPDDATADRLIADKISGADWGAHIGRSPSLTVNAASAALALGAAIAKPGPDGAPPRGARGLAYAAIKPPLRWGVRRMMSIMGGHFVLGQTIGDALRRAAPLERKGFAYSYDMLGEAAHAMRDAERYYDEYAEAIEALAGVAPHGTIRDNPGISVKLTALHPRYEFAQKARVMSELAPKVKTLALAAMRAGVGFNIDAEEAERLDISLDLIEALIADPDFRGWDGLGVVVQAYQKRAPLVIDWLEQTARAHGRRIMVRLVKGAYWDSEIKRAQTLGLPDYPVFTRKANTDLCYLVCARKLLDARDVVYPQFATHNAHTAAAILHMAGDAKDFEFQRLHGMGEELHDHIRAKHGLKVRIYAPVGAHRDLLPYLVRRLLENGANSSFVNQIYDKTASVEDIVRDPVEGASQREDRRNPLIRKPAEIFLPERGAARGWDLSDPSTAQALMSAANALSAEKRLAAPIVNGEPRLGARLPVRNPANTDEIVGEVCEAGSQDVEDALAAAHAAFPAWRGRPAAERAAIARRIADLYEGHADVFLSLCIREAGKTWPDAVAELREAVDFCRYYATQAERLEEGRDGVGVMICISPWNFPLAIFTGQIVAALVAGNAVIAKPAEQTPLIAAEAVRLMHRAGTPADVLHFLPGDGARVGGALVADPRSAGVCFTGSTETANVIRGTLVRTGKYDAPLIAETGGVNAMIIDSTALPEQAVQDVIASAFQSAGQRCSALRVLYVQDDIAPAFIELLQGAMAELRVGDPGELRTDIGPLIDGEARRNISNYLEEIGATAKLIARADLDASRAGSGYFLAPSAFEVSDKRAVRREVFGPVLHVCRYAAGEDDEVIDAVNDSGYGLTMGMHSRIDSAYEAAARRAHVGNLYVNRNQIGAVVGVQPFGGEGLSGTGPKAGGPHYLLRMTHTEDSRPNGATDDGATNDGAAADNTAGRDAKLTDDRKQALAAACAAACEAQRRWEAMSDREAALRNAARRAAGNAVAAAELEEAAREYARFFGVVHELPSPAGEHNSLRLAGRGVMACFGGGAGDLAAQAARCVAAGNAALCVPRKAGDRADIEAMARALESAGAPAGLVLPMDAGEEAEFEALAAEITRNCAISGALCEGPSSLRRAIAERLAERDGPILPLLSRYDDAYRFAAERTLTLNIAAAGGDPDLLALPG